VQDRAVPDVPLVDAFGRPASLADFAGRVVVLAPFLSLCQEECPLVTGAFIALKRDVRAAGLGRDVVFAEITVDPGRDTPARLAEYGRRFGADWPLLTGSADNLNRLWRFFGVAAQIVPEGRPPQQDWLTGLTLTYDVSHTDGYILIDRRGHERFVDVNAPNLHGRLGRTLTGLLSREGRAGLRHPQGPSWTVADALASLSWLVGRDIPQTST
jgi:protein SCO1/2